LQIFLFSDFFALCCGKFCKMVAVEPWQKALTAASAAAALAALAFCATRGGEALAGSSSSEFAPAANVTKEKLRQILQEVIESQRDMKDLIQKLTAELRAKPSRFEDVYERVQKLAPKDPLEKHGLSTLEFDVLIDQRQDDPAVRDSVAKIMGMPSPSDETPNSVQQITVQQVVDVHAFMLAELTALLGSYDAGSHDSKVALVAIQALVGAKIEEKFKLTSKDVESAALMHHTMLATDADFAKLSVDIQAATGKLTGASFSSS